MKLQLVKKIENKALHSAELLFDVGEVGKTPTRKELLPKVAALTGAKENLVVIEKVKQFFGSPKVTMTARVYNDEATMRAVESKHLVGRDSGNKKKGGKKEEKEGEEAAPATKPAGEKKEEGQKKEGAEKKPGKEEKGK